MTLQSAVASTNDTHIVIAIILGRRGGIDEESSFKSQRSEGGKAGRGQVVHVRLCDLLSKRFSSRRRVTTPCRALWPSGLLSPEPEYRNFGWLKPEPKIFQCASKFRFRFHSPRLWGTRVVQIIISVFNGPNHSEAGANASCLDVGTSKAGAKKFRCLEPQVRVPALQPCLRRVNNRQHVSRNSTPRCVKCDSNRSHLI